MTAPSVVKTAVVVSTKSPTMVDISANASSVSLRPKLHVSTSPSTNPPRNEPTAPKSSRAALIVSPRNAWISSLFSRRKSTVAVTMLVSSSEYSSNVPIPISWTIDWSALNWPKRVARMVSASVLDSPPTVRSSSPKACTSSPKSVKMSAARPPRWPKISMMSAAPMPRFCSSASTDTRSEFVRPNSAAASLARWMANRSWVPAMDPRMPRSPKRPSMAEVSSIE